MRRPAARWRRAAGSVTMTAALAACGAGPTTDSRGLLLAPFVPTHDKVGDRMLSLASVGPEDVVYDLGSGDGRLVIRAARDYGAEGVGIELDRELVKRSREQAEREGVSDRTRFVVGDVMEADITEATVVTLYLMRSTNERLQPRLEEQLGDGARIISHEFEMGSWAPDIVERFRNETGKFKNIYLWRIRKDEPTDPD